MRNLHFWLIQFSWLSMSPNIFSLIRQIFQNLINQRQISKYIVIKNLVVLFVCVSSECCWNAAPVLGAKTGEWWHNRDREPSSLWIHSLIKTSIYLLCHLTRRELLWQLQGKWIEFDHIVCRKTARANDLFQCECAEYLWEINLQLTIWRQFWPCQVVMV